MKKTIIKLLLLTLCSGICACGGGGGGSDSGSDGSNPLTSSPGSSASTGVRLLSGAVDASPIQLYNGSKLLSTARFGMPAVYKGTGTGAQALTVVTANTTKQIFTTTVNVASNERITLLMHGDNEDLGLRFSIIGDTRGAVPAAGNTKVRVIHALSRAGELRASVGGTAIPSSIGFGKGSDYVEIPAGKANLHVTRVSDGKVVASGTPEFSTGKYYSVVVEGEVDYFVASPAYED